MLWILVDKPVPFVLLCNYLHCYDMPARKTFFAVLMCIGYGLVSLFTAYSMLKRHEIGKHRHGPEIQSKIVRGIHQHNASTDTIQIWDVSGLGKFLWVEVLRGTLPEIDRAGWLESALQVDGFNFWYKLGYNLRPANSPPLLERSLLLTLDAKNSKAAESAGAWLEYVLSLPHVMNLGLFIIGDETCDNNWMLQYLQNPVVKFVYLVYESALIDNKKVFPWPLGTSINMYSPSPLDIDVTIPRKYSCNFVGTIFPSSSRNTLMHLAKNDNMQNCYFKWRNRWVQDKSGGTVQEYKNALKNSGLTLSPVGINAECHRTYDAIQHGSIPVVENVPTPLTCGGYNSSKAPYSILKQNKAPMIYVSKWEEELPLILKQYEELSDTTKVRKRLKLLHWYTDFKNNLKKQFIENLKQYFI